MCLSLLSVGALAQAEDEHIHEEASAVAAQLVIAEVIAVETGEEEAVVSVDVETENEEVLSSECDHVYGEFLEPNYTKCGGGLIVDYYTCSECGVECDEDGHDLDWDKVHIEGDYKHTPGERGEANYQKCTGGWTEVSISARIAEQNAMKTEMRSGCWRKCPPAMSMRMVFVPIAEALREI